MNFIKDIYKLRRVVFSLARNDFKARYVGSYFGLLWAFISPLMTIMVYWFVFEQGLKVSAPDENIPFILWFLPGMIPWFFFSDTLNSSTNSLLEYNFLVKKVVFKVSLLPLVKILSSLFIHLFFVILIFLFYISYGYPFSIYNLQAFYYSFCLIILLIGISWLASAITPFFRDMTQVVSIILQFGMWLTPIVWSTSIIPDKLALIFKLNPLYYIVEGYRDSFINHVWFFHRYNQTLYFWLVTIILLLIGAVVFKKMKPHFSDVL
ncbi:ABC transporter permease [Paenibacillus chitinolyticus]|uniref:ABC transporter permease n=1 Tax=Paenibacillus chitinolyticus TaxID=79263 RepID=UPI00364F4DF9